MTKLPPTQWAQREDCVLVSFVLPDATNVKLDTTANTLAFSCDALSNKYSVKLNLLHDIKPDQTSYKIHGSKVACCLFKVAATGEIWERLTKEPVKNFKHFISVDWAMWKDPEDAAEQGYGDMNFDMSQFQGMMGGMGGGEMPDSDDEEGEEPKANLDDLEK
eukprot:PhM_4_TR13457/c0_g1_i1/m.51017/K15730/PTGES3; cytosolic prostaglandin-E synthase